MASTPQPTSTIKSNGFRFVPFSKRQKQVLTWWRPASPYNDYAGIIADGAIRSGKTLCMSMSFVMWGMETFNGFNFAFCGKSVGAVHRNVITDQFLMIMKNRGYKIVEKHDGSSTYLLITHGSVSNKFYIFGGNDARSQDIIQGITLAGVMFDEVALMPESFVNQATGRCSVDGSKYWFNCNPADRLHWFKINWINQYVKKRLVYIRFTMDDNNALSAAKKAQYKANYIGVFFQRYILGLWCAAEGAIYGSAWDNEENTFDLEKDGRPWEDKQPSHYVACDYGSTNPTVFLSIWDDGRVLWCDREYYQDSRKDQQQLTPAQHAEKMDEFLGGDRSVIIIIDPAAEAFRLELRNRGFRVMEADNEVLEGIRMTSTMMSKRLIRVEKGCKGFLSEVGSYVWDEKAATMHGKEQPVKVKDHAMDAIRYYVKTRITRARLLRA